MRIYIRQLKTALFVGRSGGWQADGPHSRAFDSIVEAVDWVVENNIADVEIVRLRQKLDQSRHLRVDATVSRVVANDVELLNGAASRRGPAEETGSRRWCEYAAVANQLLSRPGSLVTREQERAVVDQGSAQGSPKDVLD